MIDSLDQALLCLQAACFGRDVYGPDHPQVQGQYTRATAALATAFQTRPRLAVIALDDRVVFDEQRLPSSASLSENLFRRVRQAGAECVVFSRGVTAAELSAWLDALSPREDAASVSDAVLPHIDMGHLDTLTHAEEAGLAYDAALGYDLGAPSGVIEDLWDQVHEAGQAAAAHLTRGDRSGVEGDSRADGVFGVDGDSGVDGISGRDGISGGGGVVNRLAEDICVTVQNAGGALLPLASLKDHDEYTSVHTVNVAMMAAALGQAVGFPAKRIHDLTIAAVLHDIGKRETPTEVLNKAGKLTDEEFDLIRQHPVAGARILMGMPGVPELAVIVAYEHHMNLDGTGYPRQPEGWRPHLASQIVQLADVYDALRTHRPYRAAMAFEKARGIIEEGRGTRYNAALVDLFFDRVACPASPEDRRHAS